MGKGKKLTLTCKGPFHEKLRLNRLNYCHLLGVNYRAKAFDLLSYGQTVLPESLSTSCKLHMYSNAALKSLTAFSMGKASLAGWIVRTIAVGLCTLYSR
jgi:hypothetical protein